MRPCAFSMLTNPLKPFYKSAPIRDLDTLAEVLGVSRARLGRLARNACQLYRLVPQRKKDGSLRKTYDAFPALKSVQQRIKVRLLEKVMYPLYLQGGIRDRENPRDYARNAGIHAGRACVVNEDIADFFPSTTPEQVLNIWQHFFRFPVEVAECLTRLTTRRGELPQGAKTSSYLANLVFWETEFDLVRHLQSKGFAYSRLVDDITVSSASPMSRREKSMVMSLIYSFIKRSGYTPKYRKHAIFNRNEKILVNSLVVNAHAALPLDERQGIRALVHRTIRTIKNEGMAAITATRAHVIGKIGKVTRFHPRTGKGMASDLQAALGKQSAKSNC